MEHAFKINDFEGPLDLLLHLIKQQKMDIFEIEISRLTDQYIDFINNMQDSNLEVASEYILMASTLVELKSKLLLPKPIIENDDDYEINNQDVLVKRLIEYKKYKEITSTLKDLNNDRLLVYTKPIENIDSYLSENTNMELPVGIEMYDLIHSINKMYQRLKQHKPINTFFENNEVSVEHRSNVLLKQLASFESKRVSLYDLVDIKTRSYLIVTFLAILDLAKQNKIIIEQDINSEDILVSEV